MQIPGTCLIFLSAVLTRAITTCEWGKYGDDCDKRCPPNCQVNSQRNLTHCNKETGECSDGCITGWYAAQCDQRCSKNCLDNVCNQVNGHCTRGCSGNQIGDFCEATKGSSTLPYKDSSVQIIVFPTRHVKPDGTSGLSTTSITLITTLLPLAAVIFIVRLIFKRKSTGCQRDGSDPEDHADMSLYQNEGDSGDPAGVPLNQSVKCATLSRIPAMAAEDMKEIAHYASWNAANTMKRYRADAQRDESKVRRHYDSICSSGVFSNEFCSVYEQMAWAAAWSTASERFGTKKDARLYKKKWLDFHMELFRTKEVTSQLANDLRSLCWSSAWYTANTRKGYRRDAEADFREMDVYYDRIRAS